MQPNQIGSIIAFHRKRAGLSQTELARYAGVSRYVVQDLEAGTGRTTWNKLEAVLTILNLRLEPEGPLVEEWRHSLDESND
jgi:transcriptional regulator with XRE-family HTH domain